MYPWVSEGSVRKYHRALALLKKEGKEVSEAAVKELYTKWGGLLLGEPSSVLGVPEGAEEEALERAEESQPEVVEPVRNKRASKK